MQNKTRLSSAMVSNTLITQQLVIKKSNIDFSQDKMQINAIRMETYLNDVAGDASSKQDMIADPFGENIKRQDFMPFNVRKKV